MSFPVLVLTLLTLAVGCSSRATQAHPSAPPAWDGTASESLRIPGGQSCLNWLNRLGIAHRVLPPKPGVATPVEVVGPIGGVNYLSRGQRTVVCDCRLALALDWIGPYLRQQGVTDVIHSGAYVYRTTKSGRPSLHARGLAIDVHAITIAGFYHTVEKHFLVDSNCGAAALNDVTCRLRALRLFRELITPNHNADHRDHLHLAIAPLG